MSDPLYPEHGRSGFIPCVTEPSLLPGVPRKCNLHNDCEAADAKARAAGRYWADHCYSDDCEDCYGK